MVLRTSGSAFLAIAATILILQSFLFTTTNADVFSFRRKTPQHYLHTTATTTPQSALATRAGNNENDVSSVLTELQETIQQLQSENEALKNQLSIPNKPTSSTAAAVSHGSHGAGSEISAEELESYLKQPFYAVALARVGWLAVFLVSLSFTALIMNGFEHTLQKQIELSYFVPLLVGHGGNTGGQAVGSVLSALSANKVQVKDAPQVILKETLSGILMGIILSIMVAPTVYYGMGISLHVTAVIFLTVQFMSASAATLGAAIPFACAAVGLDPTVVAAPAMTSLVDIAGLMGYFLIAKKVFKMFGIEL